jgi:hypothetical protein
MFFFYYVGGEGALGIVVFAPLELAEGIREDMEWAGAENVDLGPSEADDEDEEEEEAE